MKAGAGNEQGHWHFWAQDLGPFQKKKTTCKKPGRAGREAIARLGR